MHLIFKYNWGGAGQNHHILKTTYISFSVNNSKNKCMICVCAALMPNNTVFVKSVRSLSVGSTPAVNNQKRIDFLTSTTTYLCPIKTRGWQMFLVLLPRVFAWLFSGGKNNMWSEFFFLLSTVQLSKTYKHPSLILSMVAEGWQNGPRFLKPLSRSLICLHFHVFVMLMNFLIKLPAYNIFGWTITMIRANKTGIHLLWSFARNFTLTESEVHIFKILFQKSKLVVKL